MEQNVGHHLPTQAFGSFRRLRARGVQLSIVQESDHERSSVWNEGTINKITESDGENMNLEENSFSVKKPRFIRRRIPLTQIEEKNTVRESIEGVGVLGTQSAKKLVPESNINFRKGRHRRSCAPRFMNTGSASPWHISATPGGGYKNETTTTSFSSLTKCSRNQGGDSENAPEVPVGSGSSPRFVSRLERRRRSRLMNHEEGLKVNAGDNKKEDCYESMGKNEHKRIQEDQEKRTDHISSSLTRSRIKKDNQQDAAGENTSENKSHFPTAEKRKRLNGPRRRSFLEIVRQRAYSSQSSVEKPTNSGHEHIPLMGQRPGNSMHRSQLNNQSPHSNFRRPAMQKDHLVADKAMGETSQECRRVLQFESGDEGEDNEDHTAPLTMMAQTPIIMRASVLQNPVDHKQQKEVSEPVIKKSLHDGSVKTSRLRRRFNTRINQQLEGNSQQSQLNMEKKVSKFSSCATNKSDNSSSEALFGHRKESENIGLPSHTLGYTTDKRHHTLQEASTLKNTNSSSKKKSIFHAHPSSTKKIQRRRSAAVVCVRTPMKRKSIYSEARSTSKLTNSSVSSKLPTSIESQKPIRSRRSFAVSRRLSSQLQTNHQNTASENEGLVEESQMQNDVRSRRSFAVNRWLSSQSQTNHQKTSSENEGLVEESQMQNDGMNYKVQKVDASTNTTINLANIKHVDLKVLENIENLVKEQEELNSKAVMLQEKTAARRLEMKEKRLMESFMISISPLRRLKAMFSENNVDESEVQESPQLSKGEGEDDVCDGAVATHEAHITSDKSEMERVNPKPLTVRDYNMQWRRRGNDNRLTRTYQEPSIEEEEEEEEFIDAADHNTSPFTTWVGDCERPSLAPMTPHSRHHVSLIKLSLKEQLEQLYDD